MSKWTPTVLASNLTFEQALSILKAGGWIALEPINYEPLELRNGTIVHAKNGEAWIAYDRHAHPLLRSDWQHIDRDC